MARAATGLNDPTKPLATFLFAGPTGVGKTELAKQLALDLYGSTTEYVRLDMSEFAGKDDGVYKLIGGDSIWKNSDKGGRLTNALEAHPNAIILFDEFEKASEAVHNLMLQVLDEGRLTSGLRKTYDLTANILIFTSNAGMSSDGGPVGFGQGNAGRYVFSKEKFEETFPKELVNRFSSIVAFQPLSKAALQPILALKLKPYLQRLAKRGITLTLSDAARAHLVDLGYDPDMGARPLERAIAEALIGPLADRLLDNDAAREFTADVAGDGALAITAVAPKAPAGPRLVVDGAFNPHTGTYGYGAILTVGATVETLHEAGQDQARLPLRDFGGQMLGVVAGIRRAIALGADSLTIAYDYAGIEKWVTGAWHASQPLTREYQATMQDLAQQIALHFVYSPGTADDTKRRANDLAKQAAGLVQG
nr:AAA family ATPase [Lacticaseibacillus kribbianus]